jgi:hypothetical protein
MKKLAECKSPPSNSRENSFASAAFVFYGGDPARPLGGRMAKPENHNSVFAMPVLIN